MRRVKLGDKTWRNLLFQPFTVLTLSAHRPLELQGCLHLRPGSAEFRAGSVSGRLAWAVWVWVG